MNPGQQIVIVVSVLLVVWYVAFSYVNRKRGVALYRWLREGIEQLGALSHVGWIGSASNGGQMLVDKAQPPFSRVEVVFLLQSREVLPLWLFNLGRGKRDEMIVKAVLRSAPLREIEASPGGGDVPDGYTDAGEIGGLRIAVKGGDAVVGRALRKFLEQYGAHVRLFSLQRKKPHLIIRLRLETGLDAAPSGAFFEALQRAFTR